MVKKSTPIIKEAVEVAIEEMQATKEESTTSEDQPVKEEESTEAEIPEAEIPEAEIPEEKPKISKYEVVIPFHDINNFAKEYKVGQTVTGIKEGRLTLLLQRGYLKEV
jgi:phage antirepressor YoqD-like protein